MLVKKKKKKYICWFKSKTPQESVKLEVWRSKGCLRWTKKKKKRRKTQRNGEAGGQADVIRDYSWYQAQIGILRLRSDQILFFVSLRQTHTIVLWCVCVMCICTKIFWGCWCTVCHISQNVNLFPSTFLCTFPFSAFNIDINSLYNINLLTVKYVILPFRLW